MNEQLNRVVQIGGKDYSIVRIYPIEAEHANIIKMCNATGKYPAYFAAARILKNGKLSARNIKILFIFQKSGNFVVIGNS